MTRSNSVLIGRHEGASRLPNAFRRAERILIDGRFEYTKWKNSSSLERYVKILSKQINAEYLIPILNIACKKTNF